MFVKTKVNGSFKNKNFTAENTSVEGLKNLVAHIVFITLKCIAIGYFLYYKYLTTTLL